MNKLIITNTDWADEMSIVGYEIITERQYTWAQSFLNEFFKKHPDEVIEVSVGTNQEVSFSSSWLSHFSVEDISEEHEHVLREVLGAYFGESLFERLLDTIFETMEYDAETYGDFEVLYKEYQKVF